MGSGNGGPAGSGRGGPAGPSAGRGWLVGRRRRRVYVAAAAGLTILGCVAVDVGGGSTTADKASDLHGFVTVLNTDMGSCASSVTDSVEAYDAVVSGGQPGRRTEAIGLIRGDEPDCTPEADTNLYDMITTEAPGTLRPWNVQSVVSDLATWAFPNAAAAIDDVAQLLSVPGDGAARKDLQARIVALQRLDASAERTLAGAAAGLHTSVQRLDLGTTGGLEAVAL